MDTKMRKSNRHSTSGVLSLEASIVLTVFLFLMLFLYSFLVVFEARNEIAHVLLTTADSLALDAFADEALGDDSSIQGFLYAIYGKVSDSDGTYTETDKWYGDESQIEEAIETRFVAYLAGGDRDAANEILLGLNIVGGINGLDFSKSNVSGNDLNLVVQYKIDYEFRVFGMDQLNFSQSCCSKLWKE